MSNTVNENYAKTLLDRAIGLGINIDECLTIKDFETAISKREIDIEGKVDQSIHDENISYF